MKNPAAEAHRWWDQAQDDLAFVRWVHEEGRFFDKGCFVAQQAAEKALKACLYASGERFVPGHPSSGKLKFEVQGSTFEVISGVRRWIFEVP